MQTGLPGTERHLGLLAKIYRPHIVVHRECHFGLFAWITFTDFCADSVVVAVVVVQLNVTHLHSDNKWNLSLNAIKIFSVVYTKSWPVRENSREPDLSPDVILRHTLSWPSSEQFFTFVCESVFDAC